MQKYEKLSYQLVTMWKTTLKKLRFIHAETGETMIKVLDRVISAEWQRLQENSGKDTDANHISSNSEYSNQ